MTKAVLLSLVYDAGDGGPCFAASRRAEDYLPGGESYGPTAALNLRAVSMIQVRYARSGVTPVSPPQPSSSRGAVDQLTRPIKAPEDSYTGAPESPVQAPRPMCSSRVAMSNRRT